MSATHGTGPVGDGTSGDQALPASDDGATRGQPEEPMSYDTVVEEADDGQFEVVVHTTDSTGGRRMVVGTHATREKAELAASLVDRSAKRYEGVGNSDASAPTFADPEKP